MGTSLCGWVFDRELVQIVINVTGRMEEESGSQKDLPLEVVPLENQVAGHNFTLGHQNIGLLKHPEGYLLKPVYKTPQAESEIGFYEAVQWSENNELVPVRKFVPQFMGTVIHKINSKDVKFLKLEDVSEGLKKPCIMDVKMGARTWDPNATETKRKVEDKKYASCKTAFGFCVPGYQVYNITTGVFTKHGKEYCKLITKETLPVAFREYLNYDSGVSSAIQNQFLVQLQEIKKWWETQRLFHIYASSILLLYDAQRLENLKRDTASTDPTTRQTPEFGSWIRVFMIDFAHVFPAENRQLDYNYMNGLDTLINLLKTL